MNKDSKMIDKLIETDKQMKSKINVELYAIIPDGKDTWHIISGDGEIIETITKDIMTDYCKKELEDCEIECISAEIMTDNVWWNWLDNSNITFIDTYCQYWDKFLAWFHYICVKVLAEEITATYKQRLDDFE